MLEILWCSIYVNIHIHFVPQKTRISEAHETRPIMKHLRFPNAVDAEAVGALSSRRSASGAGDAAIFRPAIFGPKICHHLWKEKNQQQLAAQNLWV